MNGFGDFLYKLRKEKGLTQAELASLLGVTNKAVSKWETGEAMPETGLLLPIARIFNVTVDELLAGERSESADAKNTSDEVIDDEKIENYIKRHMFTRGKDDDVKTLADKICAVLCAAVIMLGVTAYLAVGCVTKLWHPFWVLIPDAALFCGILGIAFDLFNSKKRRKKLDKGENPFTGAICGFVMLACIIVYLNLGAFKMLWHPYWIMLVSGAAICTVVGGVGEALSQSKKKN